MEAEQLARLFHEIYEELAPAFAYQTRRASRKPWKNVPERNKQLMIAVAEKILNVFLFENKGLIERIEFAVSYLPECPDKAKSILVPALNPEK